MIVQPYFYKEEDEIFVTESGYRTHTFNIYMACWDRDGKDIFVRCKWPRSFIVVIPKGGSLEDLKEFIKENELTRYISNKIECVEKLSRNGYPAKTVKCVTLEFKSSISMYTIRKHITKRKIKGKKYTVEEQASAIADVIKMRANANFKSCAWIEISDYKLYKERKEGFKKYLYVENPVSSIRELTEEEVKEIKKIKPSVLSFDLEVVSSDLERHPVDHVPFDRIFCCGVTFKANNDISHYALLFNECAPFQIDGKDVEIRVAESVYEDIECRKLILSGDYSLVPYTRLNDTEIQVGRKKCYFNTDMIEDGMYKKYTDEAILVYADTGKEYSATSSEITLAIEGNTIVVNGNNIASINNNNEYIVKGDFIFFRKFSKTEEIALIELFEELIVELNPDIIVGHNIFGFDFPYMLSRMTEMGGRTGWTNISKMDDYNVETKKISWSSSAYNENEFCFPLAPGRIILDTLNHFRRAYKLNSYSLDSLASHFLGKNKIDLDYWDMYKLQHYVEGKLSFEEVKYIFELHAPEELEAILQ